MDLIFNFFSFTVDLSFLAIPVYVLYISDCICSVYMALRKIKILSIYLSKPYHPGVAYWQLLVPSLHHFLQLLNRSGNKAMSSTLQTGVPLWSKSIISPSFERE